MAQNRTSKFADWFSDFGAEAQINLYSKRTITVKMYQKIAIIISLLLATILVYLANNYAIMQEIKSIPIDKIRHLTDAADNFYRYGFMVCGTIWILTNFMILKTKQMYWLWIPFVFTTIVALTISYQTEDIFLFNKENGLWKGGFSLSYVFSIIVILGASILLIVNYFRLLNKKSKVITG